MFLLRKKLFIYLIFFYLHTINCPKAHEERLLNLSNQNVQFKLIFFFCNLQIVNLLLKIKHRRSASVKRCFNR